MRQSLLALFIAGGFLAAGLPVDADAAEKGARRSNTGDLQRCMNSIRLAGPGAKSQLKQLTGASEARLPSVVCTRLARGVRSGRITWADVGRMQRGQGTQVFRILKGH